jgi:hypothetical protein
VMPAMLFMTQSEFMKLFQSADNRAQI